MGAIPTSDLPGHKQLHSRTVTALERCQESQDIDFKESAPWDVLQWRIIHTALGMGNLRDGGIIIIGVSERGRTWNLIGIEDPHLGTYDVDTNIDKINAYVSPYVDISIVIVEHSGKRYLAIQIHEFRDIPLVCKKNGPEDENITKGCVYIRPPGMPKTTKVTDANQMHELLELAAEKRARRIIEVSRRIGMTERVPDTATFDEELKGL